MMLFYSTGRKRAEMPVKIGLTVFAGWGNSHSFLRHSRFVPRWRLRSFGDGVTCFAFSPNAPP